MKIVIDSLAIVCRIDGIACDAVSSSWPAQFSSMTLTPIAEQYHKSAVALLEQASAAFMLANYWAMRGE